MSASTTGQLKVPGASLYYEVSGSGPSLLLIPGGAGEAGPYRGLVHQLADRFTVVTYDRRGFSGSLLDEPPIDDRRLEADGSDVRHLLQQVARRPSYVFGSSSGAIVALDVLARYPEYVLKLVAHEPPLLTLLPDAKERLSFIDEVYETYRRSGVDAAFNQFSVGTGLTAISGLPSRIQVPASAVARMEENRVFWFEHELRQYPRYVPNATALWAERARLILAGGRDSRDKFPYLPNIVLARMFGLNLVDFPGGHVGYVTHPREFAEQLAEVLDASRHGVSP